MLKDKTKREMEQLHAFIYFSNMPTGLGIGLVQCVGPVSRHDAAVRQRGKHARCDYQTLLHKIRNLAQRDTFRSFRARPTHHVDLHRTPLQQNTITCLLDSLATVCRAIADRSGIGAGQFRQLHAQYHHHLHEGAHRGEDAKNYPQMMDKT